MFAALWTIIMLLFFDLFSDGNFVAFDFDSAFAFHMASIAVVADAEID